MAQATLDSERRVTAQFQALSKVALEENDHTSHQFLLWFVEEQVEEERKAQGLLDRQTAAADPQRLGQISL